LKVNFLNGISSTKLSTPHLEQENSALFLVKNAPKFSISLDWFQTHNTQTPVLHPMQYGRFNVKHLGRAGEFQNHYEIFTAGERVATLTAHPDKGVLQPDCSFLKIDNKFLYGQDTKALVLEINKELGLTFRNVSRVDIACDFNTFNNNLNPMVFIDRHIGMFAKYVKLRKAVLYTRSEHQRGTYKGRRTENQHSYIRWGSPKGNLTYYLYDKTKEQKEKKNKPWIAEKWHMDKLDPSQVWRLEFRIHSGSKGLIDEDGRNELLKFRKAKKFLKEINGKLKRGMKEETIQEIEAQILDAQKFTATWLQPPCFDLFLFDEWKRAKAFLKKFPFTREQAQEEVEFFKNFENDFKADAQYFASLDVLDNYEECFNALYHHYFDFRINDKQEKKRRMRRLSLLNIQKPDKHLMQIVETLESNRTDRITLNKVMDMNDLLRAKAAAREEAAPVEVLDAIKILISHYAQQKELEPYLKKKFPDFDFQPELDKHLAAMAFDAEEERMKFINVNGELIERAPF